MKTIEITIQELQAATRPNVYRNKKKYTRKDKHKDITRHQITSLILGEGTRISKRQFVYSAYKNKGYEREDNYTVS